MNRGQKKISNLIRCTFLFRSWHNGRSVHISNVSCQIFLSFETKITLRALKKDSVDDGTRLLRFTSFNYFCVSPTHGIRVSSSFLDVLIIGF